MLRFSAGGTDFCVHQIAHAGSVTHPGALPCFLGNKVAGAEINNEWICTYAPPFDFVTCTGTPLTLLEVKGKAITLQASTGTEGTRNLRFPISRQSTHEGCKAVSLTHRPPIPHRKYSWYSFLLEGSSAAGRIMSMKNSNDTIGNRTHDFPAYFYCMFRRIL
jgi:hypothetical protein